jgi:hypothetical protein
LNSDSESAQLIVRTYFIREKIPKKRSKIDQTGVPLEETSAPPIRRKYCWVIFHTPFDAELNAESESAHSTVRQYFAREKVQKKKIKNRSNSSTA